MVLVAIIGAALLGLTVGLLLRAFAMPSAASAERIQQIESYGFAGTVAAEPKPREPLLRDLAKTTGRWLIDRSPRISEAAVRRDLTRAGMYSVTPAAFTGYRVVGSVCCGTAFFALLLASGSSAFLVVLGTAFATVAGFALPQSILQRRIRDRAMQIDRALPELVDILVITVEAGIGLTRSMQVAAERLSGPLGDEVRLTLQEEQMGLSAGEALANMQERCDSAAMRSFVRSIAQGQTMGVSIGDIMRGLAVEMRTRRRQTAEAQAQRMPVKILFPLVFLIFPALFVVLLYPALHSFADSLGS